jgi:hypothetical protein
MKQWERRLIDLSRILSDCCQNYYDPDKFRISSNQYLQTSRTITFIIQKDKASIPNFDTWYDSCVNIPWKTDRLMMWAKDSRNKIEKEGDLETFSTLEAVLLFSYLEEQDLIVRFRRKELLTAGIKKLVRLSEKSLPTSVSDAAVIRIERQWIANSLQEWEMLNAFVYIYNQVYGSCQSLAEHIGSQLPDDVPSPSSMSALRENAILPQYIKLRDRKSRRYMHQSYEQPADFSPPEEFRIAIQQAKETGQNPSNLGEAVQWYTRFAKAMFESQGNHVSLLFLFDATWRPLDITGVHFEDQADKYIFWRRLADKVSAVKPAGLIFIGELWVRKIQNFAIDAIREMPIIDECLQVIGVDSSGKIEDVTWRILRASEDTLPTLQLLTKGYDKPAQQTPNFLLPVLREMECQSINLGPS